MTPLLICSIPRSGKLYFVTTFGKMIKHQFANIKVCKQEDFAWMLNNQKFGAFTHYEGLKDLHRKLQIYTDTDKDLRTLINEVLPGLKIIFIDRRDKVKQAISMAQAYETKVYAVFQTDNHEESPEQVTDAEIHKFIHMAAIETTYFENFFREYEFTPYRLFYENINTTDKLEKVITYLSTELNYKLINPITIFLKKMSNTRTEERYNTYLSGNHELWY